MKLKTSPWIIEASGKVAALAQIQKYQLWQGLRHKGAVVIRGFQASVTEFDQFSSQYSLREMVHGGQRKAVNPSDTIQDVTIGNDEVPGHIEMGRMPDQPDLAWFYCKQNAHSGGEHMLIDGQLVVEDLSPYLTHLFERQEIAFTATMPASHWRRSLGVESFKEAKALLAARFPQVRFLFNDSDESFEGTYTTWAFKKRNTQKAFANSILGPYRGAAGGRCHFATGADLSQDLKDAIYESYENVGVDLSLEPGDFVVLDNQRVMHGRRAFLDSPQKTRQIFAKFMKANPQPKSGIVL